MIRTPSLPPYVAAAFLAVTLPATAYAQSTTGTAGAATSAAASPVPSLADVKLLAEILIEQDVIENAPFNTGILSSSLEVIDRAIQFYLLKAQREQSADLKKRYTQKVSGFLRWRSIASQIDPLYSSLKRVL